MNIKITAHTSTAPAPAPAPAPATARVQAPTTHTSTAPVPAPAPAPAPVRVQAQTTPLTSAERTRAYRASLSEEKTAEVQAKDAQRKRMAYSLKRIALRVASTDFTEEEQPDV